MELKFESQNNTNFVHAKSGEFILTAKVNNRGYAPGFSYVLVSKKEFEKIAKLVTEANKSGDKRQTPQGKDVIEKADKDYMASIITLEKGFLVDVQVINPKHELYGLSLKWIVDQNGKTSFRSDESHVCFSPSGKTSFDFGFKRILAKVCNSVWSNEEKKFIDIYDEEGSWLTIPTAGDSAGMARASRGLILFEKVLDFASENVEGDSTTIPFAVPNF